jgi:hypothetical protein
MLAFKPTDFATGLKVTYKWYLKQRGFAKPDFSFEDELLARFGREAPKSTKIQGG